MKKLLALLLGLACLAPAQAQLLDSALAFKTVEKGLRPFDRLIVSQFVDLELQPGPTEAVRVTYEGVPADEVYVEQRGRTLHVYLKYAKLWSRHRRAIGGSAEARYRHARVKAYVTYKTLEHLELRGRQRVNLPQPLEAERFKLRLFGEIQLQMAGLQVNYLKVKLFGQNELEIADGRADFQKYKLYGENQVRAKGLAAGRVKTTSLGENNLQLNVTERLSVLALGVSEVYYRGGPKVRRRLLLGSNHIARLHE
jgi:Putative auto-transporter adhesin, head GIN domain